MAHCVIGLPKRRLFVHRAFHGGGRFEALVGLTRQPADCWLLVCDHHQLAKLGIARAYDGVSARWRR